MSAYEPVQGVVTQQGSDMTEAVNQHADDESMPAQAIVAAGIAESNLDEYAERWGGWPDVSFGIWQQTVAYCPIGDGTANPTNVSAVRSALFVWQQALDIAAPQLGTYWRQYGVRLLPDMDAAIRETCGRYNWPAQGYVGNPNSANIDRAVAGSAAYVGEAAPTPPAPPPTPALVYDPLYPPERQTYDWTCSLNTSYWMLASIGATQGLTKEQYGAEMMAAGLITEQYGLMDGSGASLAAWLTSRFGVPCEALGALGWAELVEVAGTGPVGMGSGTMYHWLAVRAPLGVEDLALMNPAVGYRGVGDRMSDEQFADWAPWAVLYIPAGEDDMANAALEAELAACQQHNAELISQVGYLTGDVCNAIQAGIDSALRATELGTCQEAVQYGIQPAVDTLRRGGAPA